MRAVLAFARFWYDFIVGDDWTVGAGVVVALVVTALLAHGHLPAWLPLPLAVAGLLALSLVRAVRATRRAGMTSHMPPADGSGHGAGSG
jgi:ABC-type cobalamin transport system permease subunit